MIVAAGVMITAPPLADGARPQVLFLLRGAGSDHPLEWCFPGGQAEAGETTAQCAARECEEECGLSLDAKDLGAPLARGIALAQTVAPSDATAPPGPPSQPPAPGDSVTPLQSEDVDFTTYRCEVKAQFNPTLCDEHIGYAWAPADRPPTPLHPGCQVALGRPWMDELAVAEAMRDGTLVSPQRFENVTLFNIRITGTGMSYRRSINEYVWREPSVYLNERFVRRCNGLAVIWVHPKKATLDSKEFNDRVVGSIFVPYIKGDEVWGIAKVYDDEAAIDMAENQLSTSPTVVFKDPAANSRLKDEDGSVLLIEGQPSLLDHVAICPAGVWDKRGLAGPGVDRAGAEEPLVLADSEPLLDLTPLRDLGVRAQLLGLRLDNLARRRA